MFLHLNTVNKQFIRLRSTKKVVLLSFFACLNCFIFFSLLSKISLGRSSEIPKFFPFSLLALDIFTLRIFQKACDYLSRFTIGRNTLSNTMNPLEFDLICIFYTKLCFKESNQNLSRVLLHIGFSFNSEKTKIFPPLVYFHV